MQESLHYAGVSALCRSLCIMQKLLSVKNRAERDIGVQLGYVTSYRKRYTFIVDRLSFFYVCELCFLRNMKNDNL